MSARATDRSFSSQLRRLGDAWLAVGAVLVIALMSLPIPPLMIDTLLAVNIASGVLLLLVALYVPTPLALSTFPSILLLTTLFRVALNVATTKQILLHAHAGDIILTFGKLVVGGSLVVGLVVFLVITLIQFIVVAKGAERVAEVGARFNLDALPGKQMSIDSDLRAGVISQSEAFERRSRLTAESQFYGAMDGAMKFVKGDAIAGIVIVAINLIGGIAIGVLGKDMALPEAVRVYSILTIGDGLVSQIPALFVATAAGIVTTRTTSEDTSHLAAQIGRQLMEQPNAMIIAGCVLAMFSLVPGFPVLVFLVLGASAVGLGRYQTLRRQRAAHERLRTDIPAATRDGDRSAVLFVEDEQPRHYLPFRLDIATALMQRLTAASVNAALNDLRRDLKGGLGLPFPGLAIQQMRSFEPNRLRLLVQDLPAADFEVPTGVVLALATEARLREAGLPTETQVSFAPFNGMHWIPVGSVAQARAAGIATLTGAEAVGRVVGDAMLSRVDRLLGVQEVRQMLREVELSHGDLVREALSVMPLARLTDLFVELAQEGVPLRDVPAMLQAIISLSATTRDLRAVHEALRLAQSRTLVARVAGSGIDGCVGLSQELEDQLRSAIVERPEGTTFAMSPAAAKDVIDALLQGAAGAPVVVSADLRSALARMVRAAIPGARVLSFPELERAGYRGTPARQIAAPLGATPRLAETRS